MAENWAYKNEYMNDKSLTKFMQVGSEVKNQHSLCWHACTEAFLSIYLFIYNDRYYIYMFIYVK